MQDFFVGTLLSQSIFFKDHFPGRLYPIQTFAIIPIFNPTQFPIKTHQRARVISTSALEAVFNL